MANPILSHFSVSHLSPALIEVSEPVGNLAQHMDVSLPDCAEKSAGLRKLLEAKDCFVRARIEELRRAEAQKAPN